MTEGFDPTRHLTRLSGKDYLEVKWRLVWFRSEHPDGFIDTEVVELSDQRAVFKAVVECPGAGRAAGFGSETPGDFRDYIEKAETKAIGRALAALGFGTQFSMDHDFGSDQGRVVDTPVGQPSKPSPATQQWRERRQQAPPRQDPVQANVTGDGITEPQRKAIFAIGGKIGLDHEKITERLIDQFAVDSVTNLSKQQASMLIDQLQNEQRQGKPGEDRFTA